MDHVMESKVRLLLVMVIIGLSAYLGKEYLQSLSEWNSLRKTPAQRVVTPRGKLSESETATIELFENVSPCVVYVTTIGYRYNFFRGAEDKVPEGTGSGFVWDDQGHIVTNFHVIRSVVSGGRRECEVTLKDHSSWPAKVVGYAPDIDIAVLKIAAPARLLPPIPVGSSEDLKVGQMAYAIGNPFGFDQTLTSGIISNVDRDMQFIPGYKIHSVIQTDAAINPGNSGGPLLDSAGRLIGINTAITQSAQNIGFAVPVDLVREVVPQLIEHGRDIRVGLGVRLLRREHARSLGIHEGVVVSDVDRGSGADEAGIRRPRRVGRSVVIDVILKVDGKPVNSISDVRQALSGHKEGDVATLSVLRDGRVFEVDVKLSLLN